MIVVDVETTGVDPHKHSLLSIGAIDLDDPARRFYEECHIWDGAHIMDESLTINGFTREQVTDKSKKTAEQVSREFLEWAIDARDHTIAGQNPSFDRDFIKVQAERSHINWPLPYRSLDLHSMCYLHMVRHGVEPPVEKGRTALNSDAILQYCGLQDEPKPHKAINGATMEAEALSRLLYNKIFLEEYSTFPIPWTK